MGSCQPDGATIPGLILIGLFIATMGGLFSKDKDTRRNALIVGMSISFGGGLVYLLIGCSSV
jgi:hypothetical protein